MEWNGKKGLALLLIVLGALILFDKIGFGVGHIMGYLIPVAMVVLGYIGVRNGKKLFGWLVLIIGLMILIGKMSGLISLAIGIGMILFGISLFRKERNVF